MINIEKSFTTFYIIILSISIILNLICPFLNIYWYFAFSIKQIKENYQYWRLITNYLVKPTRKVGYGTFINLLSLYISLNNMEKKAKLYQKYSKLIMTIIIICTINLLSVLFLYYKFDIKESRSLINELSYALIAISTYKYPNDKFFINLVPIRQKFAPIAIIIMRIIINKDASMDILKEPFVGFFTGFLFCIVTKKLKVKIVPQFLKDLLKEPTDEQRKMNKQLLNNLSKFIKSEKRRQKREERGEESEDEEREDNTFNNYNLYGINNRYSRLIPRLKHTNVPNLDIETYFGRNKDYSKYTKNNDDEVNKFDDGEEIVNDEKNMDMDKNDINEEFEENNDNKIDTDKDEEEKNEEIEENYENKNNMDKDEKEMDDRAEEKQKNFHYKID